MEELDASDRSARHGVTEAAYGAFDFGKLGHWCRERKKTRKPIGNRRLTHAPRSAQVAPVASSTQSTQARRHRTSGGRASVADRTPGVQSTLLIVLALNATVTLLKVGVGIRTGALTVLGAALESGLDSLNNLVGVVLAGVAGRAPDEEHPYGHDKFETLGAIGIVGFLSISCFELLREGIEALVARRAPHTVGVIDLAVVSVTLVVNVFVVVFERHRGRALNSAFLLADAWHTAGDILVTLLALASLALWHVGLAWLDSVLAIAVALIIAWSGGKILRESIPILVDERAIDAHELRNLVLGVPDIRDVRSIRSRFTASGQLFAEVTVAVSGRTSVEEAHRLADAVEAAIEREFGTSQVTVHVEPA